MIESLALAGHRFVKHLTLLLLISLLSACSWFGKDDPCPDGQCEVDRVTNAETRFYCYGTAERIWECEFNADDSRIVTVIPEGSTPLPATTATVASAARVESVEHVENVDSAESRPSAIPPAQTTPSRAQPVTESQVTESDWSAALLAFPESSYTVQLIAMRQLDDVLTYADQVNVGRPLSSRIETEGQIWYVLLLGIYPDFETAETARTQWIGTRVLKVEPWVRKLAPLQTGILAAQAET